MSEPPLDRDRGASTVDESSASPGVGPADTGGTGARPGGAPQGSWGAADGATARQAAAGPRPGSVTAASIILAVLGVLGAVGGALLAFAGSQLGRIAPGGMDPALIGGVTVAGIVALVIGVVQLLGGIGSWGGRNWGRILGLVGSAIGVILNALGALGGLGTGPGTDPAARTTTLVTGVVLLIAFAYCFYALWRHADWFRTRSATQ